MTTLDADFDFQFTRFLQCAGLDLNEFTRPTQEELMALDDGTPEGNRRFQDAMRYWEDPRKPPRSPCYNREHLKLAWHYFRDVVAGDDDAGTGLVLLLNHHRPHIAWAFFQLCRPGYLTRRQFGRVLGSVYTDGHVFGPFLPAGYKPREVVQMFELADPRDVMGPGEFEVFASLPDTISIFRGTAGQTSKSVRYDMSWTRDRSVAVKFARWHKVDQREPGQVWAGLVKRSDVLAYFGDRNEDEIVVRPGRVYAVRVEHQKEQQDAA